MDFNELLAFAAPNSFAALQTYRDKTQLQNDLTSLQKDPSYQIDPTKYYDPTVRQSAYQQAAVPALQEFAKQYEGITGTSDPRFWGDQANRDEVMKAGLKMPSLTNPVVASNLSAFAKDGDQEMTARAASQGDPWAAARIASDKDLASSFHLAQQGVDIPIKRDQAQQAEDRRQGKENESELLKKQTSDDQSAFDRIVSGIGGGYTPAQPIRDGITPTGPNVAGGLDYSDAQGNPSKPSVMPYDQARSLILQAASDYPKANAKEALAELEKRYKETFTTPAGQGAQSKLIPAAQNWLGTASNSKEQLQLAANSGDPIAQRLIKSLDQRELDMNKAKAEDRRTVIVNNPLPPRVSGNLNINGISDTDAALLTQKIDSGQLDASKVNSRTAKLYVQMIKSNPNLDFNNSTATSGALKKVEAQRSTIETFERTASKNFDLVENLYNKNPQGTIMLLNKLKTNFNTKITGDADTVAMGRALKTALNEYAKVVTGQTGGAAVSDSARREVETLLSQADTPEAFKQSIANHRQEMRNRMDAFGETIDSLKTGRGGNTRQPGTVQKIGKYTVEVH